MKRISRFLTKKLTIENENKTYFFLPEIAWKFDVFNVFGVHNR